MKVALFSQDMSGGTFGAVFSGLANALAANGVSAIDLLTVKGDMAAAEHPFPAGARPIRLAGSGSAGAIWPLRRHLLDARPDVLIAGPIIPNLAAVVAGRTAPGWRGRLILSHHHPVRLARGQSWKNSTPLVRLLYRFADGSFAVSPAVREEVIEVAGLDPARVECIPNVLPPMPPLAEACPHPWLAAGRAGGPVFVTVGRLEPVKNLPLLLDAFAEIAAPLDARLLIAGSGSAEAGLRARIAAQGLADRVRLLGYVASPRPYLAAADAFVLASNEEGFGQVLAEAMREGLPVISTDALGGGARFVLDDGRAGLLVPREDARALAGALAAMADAGLRRRYAELARARARCFAPAPVGAALLRLIERLPARGRAALRRH
jgi:glycosyltransferase involved in cell wall biosynthesis